LEGGRGGNGEVEVEVEVWNWKEVGGKRGGKVLLLKGMGIGRKVTLHA